MEQFWHKSRGFAHKRSKLVLMSAWLFFMIFASVSFADQTSTLKFVPDNANSYRIQFVTNEGLEYDAPLASLNSNSIFFGDGAKPLHWVEVKDIGGNWASEIATILTGHYVILTNARSGRNSGDDGSFTHVLRYEGPGDDASFTDLATGQRGVSTAVLSLSGYNVSRWSDSFIVGGNTFKLYFMNASDWEEKFKKMATDLNSNNEFGDSVDIVIQGGGILDLGDDDSSGQNSHKFNFITLAKKFDYVTSDESVGIDLFVDNGKLNVNVANGVELKDSSSNCKKGVTPYGVEVELCLSSYGNSILTVNYPIETLAQRKCQLVGEAKLQSSTTYGNSGETRKYGVEIHNADNGKVVCPDSRKFTLSVANCPTNFKCQFADGKSSIEASVLRNDKRTVDFYIESDKKLNSDTYDGFFVKWTAEGTDKQGTLQPIYVIDATSSPVEEKPKEKELTKEPIAPSPKPEKHKEEEKSIINPPESAEKTTCNTCLKDEVCYPIGYRLESSYCAPDKAFHNQAKAGEVCQNNFECKSNVCVSGQCVSESLIRRIIDWFLKLFST